MNAELLKPCLNKRSIFLAVRFEEKKISYPEDATEPRDTYIGEQTGDVPNGEGKMVWKNGAVYEGRWLDGKRHGRGSFTYPETSFHLSYVGDWEDDTKNGRGKMIEKEGHYSFGDFLSDERTGNGR